MAIPKFMEYTDWAEYKDVVITKKNLALQYKADGSRYDIWAIDAGIEYFISLSKDSPTPDPSDQKDFEDNYLADCNFASGQRPYPFATGDFDYLGDGNCMTITAGATQNLDVKIEADDIYINGGEFLAINAEVGDYIEVQAIDVDGAYYPAGTILKQWIKKWYITPGLTQHIKTPYAGKLPKDTYMRAIYHSTGATDVKFLGNYYMHKAI